MNIPVQKIIIPFIILFGLWLMLSGYLTTWFIVLGLISSSIVVAIVLRMQLLGRQLHTLTFYMRFLRYLPWLAKKVLVANCCVALHILRPNARLSPAFVKFQTLPKNALAQATLGNSITLTSGTFVVWVNDREFEVHFLHHTPQNEKELNGFDIRTAQLK